MPNFPEHLATTDVAALLGVSSQQVKILTDKRVLVRDSDGKYATIATVNAYVKYREEILHKRLGGDTKDRAAGDLVSERSKMARIQREQMEGKLISRDVVRAAYSALYAACNARLLAVASKLAPRIVLCRTPVQAKALIEREINDATQEIRDFKVESIRAPGRLVGGRGRPSRSNGDGPGPDVDGV